MRGRRQHKKCLATLSVLLCLMFMAGRTHASPVVYVFTGSASGAFLGNPFTNETVEFDCYADTTNITDTVSGVSQSLDVASAYTTVSVHGVVYVAPLTSQLSIFITTLSGSPQFTTFGLSGPSSDLLEFNDPSLYSYNLGLLATISGIGNENGYPFDVSTTLGDLHISAPSFSSAEYSVTAGTIPTYSPTTLFGFSVLDPTITFETGSTALPNIPGIHLGPYGFGGDSTFSSACFGKQIYGNANGTGYLDISFDQPMQAVGAWFTIGAGNGVTEVAYDQSNNIIDTASVPMPSGIVGPPFIYLSESATNIYKVEWRYFTASYFGVDNILYRPAPPITLSNGPPSAGQISLSFQTLPGHTNILQTSTDLAAGNWMDMTNATYLGMGEIRQITLPATNSPAGFFRVRAE